VFVVADLDHERRAGLAQRLLIGSPAADTLEDVAASVRMTVAQVDHALGDAAGNPLLFTMAVTLVAADVPFTSRATMYAAFVERLAERTGAAYAALLDNGRRYADPYEWAALVDQAGASLQIAGAAEQSVQLLAVPTPTQRRAFELLHISLPLRLR
jgi:hypothetical protein